MVEKKKLEVEVTKEAHELMLGVAKVVKAVKAAVADGFQPGKDLPAIIIEAIKVLPPAIAGIEQIPVELKEEGEAFRKAIILGAEEVVAAAIKPVA